MKLKNILDEVMAKEKDNLQIYCQIGDTIYKKGKDAPHQFLDKEPWFSFSGWIKKNNSHKGHKFGIDYEYDISDPLEDKIASLADSTERSIRCIASEDMSYLLSMDFQFKYENISKPFDGWKRYRITATNATETVMLYINYTMHENYWD